MTLLKKCPFCGGTAKAVAEQIDGKNVYYVECTLCHAIGPVSFAKENRINSDKNLSISRWNHRKKLEG